MKTPKLVAQIPSAIAPPEPAQPPTPDVQTPPPADPYNAIGTLLREAKPPHPRRNWTINDVTRTSRRVKNAAPSLRSSSLVLEREGEIVAVFAIANLVSAVSDAPEQAPAAQPEAT